MTNSTSAETSSAPTVVSNSNTWHTGPPGKRGGKRGGKGGKGGRGGREGSGKSPDAASPTQPQPQTASGGGKQDKGKGKGKGRNREHVNRDSAEAAPTEQVQDGGQELEAGEEDSTEDVCFICAEPVKYYSVSACNHRTCHVCALRLRALYKKLECTFCKEPQHSVVFTTEQDKPYEEYDLETMLHRDSKLSVYFETQDMMEETLILLRFNCPDSSCDYIGNGWGDLKLHTRGVHNRMICDLCIRHKKVFVHEHALYPPNVLPIHLPSMSQRHRSNQPRDQVEGGVHPLCDFCRECFFGDDELYAHCRERHEECFICKRNDIRHQYFQNYDNLERHFNEAHHPCAQPQCLAQKFVVFATVLDLKAHMVEQHGGDMTSRDRKDARRIVADFTFEDRHVHGRRDHHHEREREPPPSWPPPSPVVPPEASHHSRGTGQNKRREAFGARLTSDSAPGVGESTPSMSQPAIEFNRAPTPTREGVEPAVVERHAAFMSRLQLLVANPTTAIPAARAAMRGYRSSESSAQDFISTIWNILDTNLEHTAIIVNAFVDLLEEEEKKKDLLKSWNGFAIEQRRQFPELVPTAVGANYATIATGRVLNAKHSTITRSSQKSSRMVWDRVEQAASSAAPGRALSSVPSSSRTSTLDKFPPLSTSSSVPATRAPSQTQRMTPWTSASATVVQSLVPQVPDAKVQVVAQPSRPGPGSGDVKSAQRPPKLSLAQFPELPAPSTTKPRAQVSGNPSLRNILGTSVAPTVPAWRAGQAESVSVVGTSGTMDSEGPEGAIPMGGADGPGRGKKGKGKQKQTLFTLGSFPS